MPIPACQELFTAIADANEQAIARLLEPRGPLACAVDLWGLPALDLFVSWGEAPARPELALAEAEAGRATVVARWQGGHGSRIELRPGGDGWRIYAAVPKAGEDAPANPAFALAEAGGMRLPWRSPAPDAVEALLRERGMGRLLGARAHVERILLWRLALSTLNLPPLTPAAWAAAMEYQLVRHEDAARAAELAMACYGATRRELERATFLLEAGWRLHGSAP